MRRFVPPSYGKYQSTPFERLNPTQLFSLMMTSVDGLWTAVQAWLITRLMHSSVPVSDNAPLHHEVEFEFEFYAQRCAIVSQPAMFSQVTQNLTGSLRAMFDFHFLVNRTAQEKFAPLLQVMCQPVF